MKIPSDEIVFHHLSFADPSGRLFSWKGDLYRAIRVERTFFYRELFKDGAVQDLVDKKLLVATEPCALKMDGYGLVVSHKTVPFVSYPFEWCAAMLKDAALILLDLEAELTQRGLTLQDAHPWNVLFDGSKPVFVDFGSIVPSMPDTSWAADNQFRRFFLYPLLAMSEGQGRIARWLLHDYDNGVSEADLTTLTGYPRWHYSAENARNTLISTVKRLVPQSFHPQCRRTLSLAKAIWRRSPTNQKSRLAHIQRLRRKVESIRTPEFKTEWSNYYDESFPNFSQSNDWTPKHVSVNNVLTEIRPKSIMDIGSNQGWYSQLASLAGSQVVACDVDETCITRLYYRAKEKKLPILAVLLDFRNPSPGYGLCNQWLSPAIDRLRCEMVLGLALVHHLVFKQRLNFDQIVEGLSVFTTRWLVVEFISDGDRYVSRWWSEQFSWYTLDNFIAAIAKRFQNIRVIPSHPGTRVLLVAEKR